MTNTTTIEWTEATWNPVTGCSKVSPGCAHCYAETVALRFWRTQYPPVEKTVGAIRFKNLDGSPATRPRAFTDVQCHADRLDQPLRRKKPTTYFVNSMSDLFHEDVPDSFIDRVFAVMALAPRHTFQILTKRAERMYEYLTAPLGFSQRRQGRVISTAWEMLGHPPLHKYEHQGITSRPWPLPNVWLGVSVENQHFADERIPLLLQTPAAVRFISAEPLLEEIRIVPWLGYGVDLVTRQQNTYKPLDWVIVCGESGHGARPFRVQWARQILAQCKANGVACFMKQLGSNLVDDDLPGPRVNPETGARTMTVRQTLTIRDRKGGDMAEWPEDLRVREMPTGAAR